MWNKVWNECGTKAEVQWIFIKPTFLRLYDEGHSTTASDYSSLQIACWSVDKGSTATSFHLSCFCCLNMLGTVSNRHLAHVLHTKSLLFCWYFTQSIIKMCLMCQNIMKISWDRLRAQCSSSGNFFDVCDAKHLSFVESLYVYSSLYVRNECVPIRILLLRTESMYFAYDCKLHAFQNGYDCHSILKYYSCYFCSICNNISIMHIMHIFCNA